MTFKVNVSIENLETKEKTEYEVPIARDMDVEQSRQRPFDTQWSMLFRVTALPHNDKGNVATMFVPSRMDPRKRIEMLEERKAEINKEIEAITDAEWSWRQDLGR